MSPHWGERETPGPLSPVDGGHRASVGYLQFTLHRLVPSSDAEGMQKASQPWEAEQSVSGAGA